MPIIYQNKIVECNKKELSDNKPGYNFVKRCGTGGLFNQTIGDFIIIQNKNIKNALVLEL